MTKKTPLLLLLFFAFFGCMRHDGPVIWVKADSFADMVKKYPGAMIIDLRDRDAYDIDHWPGAVPLDASQPEFEGFLRQLSPRQVYLMYDYDGKTSKHVARMMEVLYFHKVYAIKGGWQEIQKWQAKTVQNASNLN